jgi:hypothetical protein
MTSVMKNPLKYGQAGESKNGSTKDRFDTPGLLEVFYHYFGRFEERFGFAWILRLRAFGRR